jgi:hypothetical protein
VLQTHHDIFDLLRHHLSCLLHYVTTVQMRKPLDA